MPSLLTVRDVKQIETSRGGAHRIAWISLLTVRDVKRIETTL